jgi:hypothetical protein
MMMWYVELVNFNMKKFLFFLKKNSVTFFNLTYYYFFKNTKIKTKEEQETQASATKQQW